MEKNTILKAKKLARIRGRSVSKTFADFIEETSRIEEEMDALREVSGIIDMPDAAEPDQEYAAYIREKHGR